VDYTTVAYYIPTGAQLWVKSYNPGNLLPATNADYGNAVAVSPSGGTVFVTGTSDGATSQSDYATIAYNAATGAQLWVKRYNGPANGNDWAGSLAVSPNGGKVFVTGGSTGPGSGYDYTTIAYSP
jgi:DNA-binding beta-propeller fold protein YncE